MGRNPTLTAYLIDVVNLVAGQLDKPGGSVFSTSGAPAERLMMMAMGAGMRRAFRRKKSRIGGFPSVIGAEPAAMLAKEISTPGDNRIRALFVSAGNPALSVPNGSVASVADAAGIRPAAVIWSSAASENVPSGPR